MMVRGRYLSRLTRTFYPGVDIHDGEGEIFVTFNSNFYPGADIHGGEGEIFVTFNSNFSPRCGYS